MADEFDIDTAITALEVKIAAMQDALASLKKARDTLTGAGIASIGSRSSGAQLVHDSFVGLSIVEASEQYLKLVGRPARSHGRDRGRPDARRLAASGPQPALQHYSSENTTAMARSSGLRRGSGGSPSGIQSDLQS